MSESTDDVGIIPFDLNSVVRQIAADSGVVGVVGGNGDVGEIAGGYFYEASEDGLSDLDRYAERWAGVLSTLDERRVTPFNADTEFDDNKRLVEGAPVYSPFVAHAPNTPWD